MSSPRLILVTGATGKQGGSLIKHLLAQPSPPSIRALSRNPNSPSAKKLASKGVQVVKGSTTDEEALVKALEGVDAAYLVTVVPMKKGDPSEEDQGFTFLSAAQKAKVPYIVFSSVSDAAPNMGVPHFEAKARVEQKLKETGIPHSIVSPVAFYDNFPTKSGFGLMMALGMFDAGLRGKKLQLVSADDIGRVVAQALVNKYKFQGRNIKLAADELTMEEVRQAYTRVEGKSVWKAWLPSIMLRLVPYDFRAMFYWFHDKGYTADIPALRKEFTGLLTLEDWLRKEQQQKQS